MRILQNHTNYPNQYFNLLIKKACQGIDTKHLRIYINRSKKYYSGRCYPWRQYIKILIPENSRDDDLRIRKERGVKEIYRGNFEMKIIWLIAHEAFHWVQYKQRAKYDQIECDQFALRQLKNAGYELKRIGTGLSIGGSLYV